MLTLTTANGNSYNISKFTRSFYINEESLNISASVEISNSVHPIDEFLVSFLEDDKTSITIQKDGVTMVTLDNYKFDNSYQEIEDTAWGKDTYTISLSSSSTSEDVSEEA